MNMRRTIGAEGFIFISLFLGIFCACGMKIGTENMFSTMMNTAYALLTGGRNGVEMGMSI